MNLKGSSLIFLSIFMVSLLLIFSSHQVWGDLVGPTGPDEGRTKNNDGDICCCVGSCYDYSYCYIEMRRNYCPRGQECSRSTCNYISPPSTTTTSSTTTSSTTSSTTIEETTTTTTTSSTTTSTIKTTTTTRPTSTTSITTSSTATSSTTSTTIEEGGDSCCPRTKICCKDCLKLWVGTKIVHGCDNSECHGECLTRDRCRKKECEDNKTANETTSTTMVTKNDPAEGKLFITHQKQKIGEEISMKIMGTDNNGLEDLYINQKNRSQPIKRFNCSGKIFCLNNFTMNLNESGNHTYWGYVVGLKPNDNREVSPTEPKKINIEVKDLSLKLHNAEIRDNNLSLTYSKDFGRCVSLSKYPQENQITGPVLCGKGEHLNRSISLDGLNISLSEKIILCDTKISNQCSNPTTIKQDIQVDEEEPRIKISTEPSGPTIHNLVKVNIIVNDSDSDIEECNMSIDSDIYGALNPEDGTYDSKTEWIHKKLGNLSEGDHKIAVGCSDVFGNIKTKTQPLEIYPIECKETDRSIDLENPGTLIYGKENYTDTCSSGHRLKEWYCSDDYENQEYNCNKYCKKKFDSSFEGKCIKNSKGGKCKCKNKKCNKIEANGNPSKKIDLVFVASGYEEGSNFKDVALKHLDFNKEYNGIFSYEPFSSNRDKFNFYYVNLGRNYSCKGRCDYSKIIKDGSSCPYDQIMVLVKNSNGAGYARTGRGYGVSHSWKKLSGENFWKDWTWRTTHEFGHSFGGLEDAYMNNRPISKTGGINCDTENCPTWCNNTLTPNTSLCYRNNDKSSCEDEDVTHTNQDCKWVKGNPPYYSSFCAPNFNPTKNFGKNCKGDVGCYWNCKGGDGFKPAIKSVMSGYKNKFNIISKNFLKNILKCCYPKSRSEFDKDKCIKWTNKKGTEYNLDWAKKECTNYGD